MRRPEKDGWDVGSATGWHVAEKYTYRQVVIISRNWPSLGGAVPPGLARPQNIENESQG